MFCRLTLFYIVLHCFFITHYLIHCFLLSSITARTSAGKPQNFLKLMWDKGGAENVRRENAGHDSDGPSNRTLKIAVQAEEDDRPLRFVVLQTLTYFSHTSFVMSY